MCACICVCEGSGCSGPHWYVAACPPGCKDCEYTNNKVTCKSSGCMSGYKYSADLSTCISEYDIQCHVQRGPHRCYFIIVVQQVAPHICYSIIVVQQVAPHRCYFIIVVQQVAPHRCYSIMVSSRWHQIVTRWRHMTWPNFLTPLHVVLLSLL